MKYKISFSAGEIPKFVDNLVVCHEELDDGKQVLNVYYNNSNIKQFFNYIKTVNEKTNLPSNHKDSPVFVIKDIFVFTGPSEILTSFFPEDIFSFEFPDEETAFYFKLKFS